MSDNDKAQRLVNTLEAEVVLLERYKEGQEELRVYLKDKEWAEMSRLLDRINLLAREISTVEERRHTLCLELKELHGLPEEDDFYRLVVRLPKELQKPLAEAYRNMKLIVTRIAGTSAAIAVYIRNLGEVLNQVLGECYPHLKGKIYSRKGRPVAVGSNPLILNRSL